MGLGAEVVGDKGEQIVERRVTVKGFIGFAARNAEEGTRKPEAAKVMKPCGELNVGARLDLEWVLFGCGPWSLSDGKDVRRSLDRWQGVFGEAGCAVSGPMQRRRERIELRGGRYSAF